MSPVEDLRALAAAMRVWADTLGEARGGQLHADYADAVERIAARIDEGATAVQS